MQEIRQKTSAGWDAQAIERFAAGSEDILILNREPLDHLNGAISAGRVSDYRSEVTAGTARDRVAAGFRELEVSSELLLNDVTGLVITFLSQFAQSRAHLRIEMVHNQTCPRFHCDNVNVRLITTYHGPTTEYRYVGEETVRKTPLYALVFLKGHMHPTHLDGVHHRSPEVPEGQKRLCVVIDY